MPAKRKVVKVTARETWTYRTIAGPRIPVRKTVARKANGRFTTLAGLDKS